MNVDKLLQGIEGQESANADLARELMATLHGWLAAGGARPAWSRHPVGTARFLVRFPQYKKIVPRAERYARAARRILQGEEDEYTSTKDLARIKRDIAEYLQGTRQEI